MDQHLHCCAAELPINQDEPLLKDPVIQQQIATLSKAGGFAGNRVWWDMAPFKKVASAMDKFKRWRKSGYYYKFLNGEIIGVSVGVVFDSQLGDCVTYLEQDIQDLIEHLQNLDLVVVGFNNKRFDNRVLSGYTDVNFSKLPTLDLLEEVHNHLGYRLSLNRLAQTTLGVEKTADGLQAPKWYKEGKIDLIQRYYRKDVEITRDLLFHGLEQGYFLFTNKAKQEVRLPLALDTTIGKILAAD